MSRPFLNASISELVEKLTLEEKISLLGAPNWWNTTAIDRLGIPAVRMSDGPNGVRGSSHFVPTPAQCIPCATSLAATFDEVLVRKVGIMLAEETKIKSSVILLAPTCNIQRSPLGGRAFESFSEDPHLSGMMAASYVDGLQSNGVSATIKHYVGNDQEHERTAADSVVSERALREIYLYPFMLAQKLARPWAVMTSYGRVDGVHVSENPRLLTNILREEWGFEGIVMSDWYGTYSVDQSINAGMELEMPGPPRWRTPMLVNHCLTAQKLHVQAIDDRVTTLLSFIQKMARRNPEIVYGDGHEGTRDSPEARAFCRQVAADGMVLLKNEDQLLPLSPRTVQRVAVIGPNAKERIISGGGSAALKASYVVSPWEGLVKGAPKGVSLEHSVGCYAHKYLPTLENSLRTSKGERGWLCRFFNHDNDGRLTGPVAEFVLQDTRIKLNDFLPEGLTSEWTIKLTGSLQFEKTAQYELGLTVAGRAKLWVNGEITIDNWTNQRPGDFYYGQGTAEEKAVIDMVANKPVDILVEYTNISPDLGPEVNSQPALMRGVRLGGCEKIDPDQAIEDAVQLAAGADAVIFIAGLSPEWESEGFDRPSLQLPGRQDETISRIAAANPRTVVCVQAGSAVSMPWAEQVDGLVQMWYSGNEVGNALADVLYGFTNPSGKLPLTLPDRIEDIAAYPNLFSENGEIHYREDLFVGYKHFQARGIRPRFPFGFGLSYTDFTISNLSLSQITWNNDSFRVKIYVVVKNTGSRTGSHVAQLYITLPGAGAATPRLQLKGFAKARDLAPGASMSLSFELDKYAVSSWDTPKNCWNARAGKYSVFVGNNSEDLGLKGEFELKQSFTWTGL